MNDRINPLKVNFRNPTYKRIHFVILTNVWYSMESVQENERLLKKWFIKTAETFSCSSWTDSARLINLKWFSEFCCKNNIISLMENKKNDMKTVAFVSDAKPRFWCVTICLINYDDGLMRREIFLITGIQFYREQISWSSAITRCSWMERGEVRKHCFNFPVLLYWGHQCCEVYVCSHD